MAISSTTRKVTYLGTGAQVLFNTTFRFRDNSHLVVKKALAASPTAFVTQTLNVDYTVAGAGVDAGGSVTFTVAPANNDVVTIERTVPHTQPIAFTTQGTFSPKTHEDDFDQRCEVEQELTDRVATLEGAGTQGTMTAGNGLAFVGSVLNAQPGNGIVIGATIAANFAGAPAAVDRSAASAGVANTLPRGDHKHDITAGVPPAGAVAVGNAAAQGVGPGVALSDHTHAVATGAPVAIGAANAAGASTAFPRLDHVHDHGVQAAGAGTQHALAVNGGTAGFLSGADKTKLDALSDSALSGSLQTVDATVTRIIRVDMAASKCYQLKLWVVGDRSTSLEGASYERLATYLCGDAGAVSIVGAVVDGGTNESDAAWDVTFVIAGQGIDIKVTGAAAKTINWKAYCMVRFAP